MSDYMTVDAADRLAAVYRRRQPRWPVITETTGLAVLLLVNRNTSQDRAVWLADPEITDALCVPAEAFAQALTGQPSPAGWRGGALASLRTLAPGALHTEIAPIPWLKPGVREPVTCFWLDDDDCLGRPWKPSPTFAALRDRLAGQPRLEQAWTALCTAFHTSEHRPGHIASYEALMCLWCSSHESPAHSRQLRSELLGLDPHTEEERWREQRRKLTA